MTVFDYLINNEKTYSINKTAWDELMKDFDHHPDKRQLHQAHIVVKEAFVGGLRKHPSLDVDKYLKYAIELLHNEKIDDNWKYESVSYPANTLDEIARIGEINVEFKRDWTKFARFYDQHFNTNE